jgi:hypothetical protein
MLTSYFFSPKKVSKIGFGLRKMRGFCFLAPAAPKKTRRTIERGLCPVKSVWLKHFLASSASTQAKPAFF